MNTRKPFPFYLLPFLLCLSLIVTTLQYDVKSVKAYDPFDCVWQGINSSWTDIQNWSCGFVPHPLNHAFIPNTANPPVTTESSLIEAETLTIEDGGQLTLSNYSSIQAATVTIDAGGSLVVNGGNTAMELSDQFINNGSLTVNGGLTINHHPLDDGIQAINNGNMTLTGNDQAFLSIQEPFTNTGDVDIQAGILQLGRSVTHSGNIAGLPGTFMTLGNDWPEDRYLFEDSSTLEMEVLTVKGGTLDMYGTFIAPLENSYLFLEGSSGTAEMIVRSSATVSFPKQVNVFSSSPTYKAILTLENNTPEEHHIQELRLQGNGEINNDGYLRIMNELRWSGGTFSGNGSTKIENGASFIIQSPVAHYLDEQALINASTAQWNAGSLALSNGASFENQVIFNANGDTTISGPTGTIFTNSGLFSKRTEGTITTVDIPFEGTGEVETMAGTLIFTNPFTAPEGTTIDLRGGTLTLANPLEIEDGASLVGAGTLNASLENAGLVSPGNSAGTMTINGDFEQVSSGDLRMEIYGPQSGLEYDQLVVEGVATLAGSLDILLRNDYLPSGAPQFTLMTYASHTGEFEQVNLSLPAGITYTLNYGETALTLTIVGLGTIRGTITCSGALSSSSSPVYVNLFAGTSTPPPVEELMITCGQPYQFEGLPAGTYYVNAFLDLNDSGGGPPDANEPLSWYGEPDALDFSANWDLTDIDITLDQTEFRIFIPMVLR